MKLKLKTGFAHYPAEKLAELADKAVLNGAAAVWSALAAILGLISTKVATLRNALMSSGAGHTAAVHIATKDLAAEMTSFAVGVNNTAAATDVDVAALDLPTVKEAVHSSEPPEAQIDLRLKNGPISCTIIGSFQHVGENNTNYLGQWTLDPVNGPWTDIPTFSNTRHFEIPGLPRGKDVWVHVAARNAHGIGPWSDPATIMVT